MDNVLVNDYSVERARAYFIKFFTVCKFVIKFLYRVQSIGNYFSEVCPLILDEIVFRKFSYQDD